MNVPTLSTSRPAGGTFPRVIGAVVAAVGALVLAGWALGIPLLSSVIPGGVTMKANTALGFILSGGALLLIQQGRGWARRVARIAAFLAGALALLTLTEYATGGNFGIDEILFPDTGSQVATSHPGRMGPNTAISFVLMAAGLWQMSRPDGKARRLRLLGSLGAMVAGMGLFALLGYAAEFSLGYGWWSLTGMAVHTALLFALLGAAVLAFAWQAAGMRWLISPGLTVGFAGGLLLIVAVAAHSHRRTTELVDAAARVTRTREVIRTMDALKADLEEEQSGIRGFVLTGDEAFLSLSTNAFPEARKNLRKLRERAADDASQRARLAVLEKLIAERLDFSQRMVELRRTSGFEAAQQQIATGRGKALSDQIRAGLREMAAEEGRLLATQQAQADVTTERTFAILPAGLLLSVLLLSYGILRLNREVAARQRGTDALREGEEKFRTLFENASDAIFLLEGEQFVDCNARTLEMFGCQSRDQIVGHPPYEFSPPMQPDGRQSRASAIEKITAALAGRPQVFEWMHAKLGGAPFPTEVSLNKVRMRDRVLLQAFVRDITARKQAEEALRAANQKMRLFFEQTPMAVIEWDMEFRVTRWNPAAQTIFGHSREEAVGQHASFIIPEVYRPQVDQVWQGLLKQSGGERSTNENIRKDGRTILCEWYNTPLIDERGTFTGAASVVMDITERTLGQQLLAWEKSALELICTAVPLEELLHGLMLGLEKQSPGALCSVLLLDADGLHLRHGAGPSLPAAYSHAVDGVTIGPAVGSCGTAAHDNRQVIVADIASDPLWADYRELALGHGLRACWSTPIHGSDGKILGTFAIYYREPRRPIPAELDLIARAVHVTRLAIERKHAEEEIRHLNTSLEQRVEERTRELQGANAASRESEERLRLATDAAEIGVWAWDLKTNNLRWDARMFALYGLPADPEGRAVYEDWRVRVLPEDLADQEGRLQQTVATCGRSQREFRIVRAYDQAVRFIQAAEMVVVGSDGQAARVVGINRDITARKMAEAQIISLNADLRNRAAELEAANKELEGFSYSVSHDLRAPLRAVDGYSRMLLEDYAERLDDDGQRMLGVIRSESQRMGQLIDDLLAFSRISRQKAETEAIDMCAMAQGVYDELTALDPERKLRLDLQPLPAAQGTRAMIRQVWVNLISNAIKFTKERPVGEIMIGVREGEAGECIYFVKDNGAGFDMRHANKLFGVFQRLHGQQEFAGTGVGLALVQRIVQRHGGRVWAEAEVGRGATFFFTIPKPKS